MKETWKTTNALLNKRCKSTNIISLTERDLQVHEEREISKTMTEYFSKISQELIDELDHSPNPRLVGEYMINEGNKCMTFDKSFKQHIMNSIDKRETSKGFGNNNISIKFLKLALVTPSSHGCICFRKSLQKGESTAPWKIGRVSPFFTEGDRTAEGYCRPATLLPLILSLFKRRITNQIII